MPTTQVVERIKIRSVSDRLRPVVGLPGFGESRRSIAKADGRRMGVGPHAN
jgi:hypothetical protein